MTLGLPGVPVHAPARAEGLAPAIGVPGGILSGMGGARTDFFVSHAGADRPWAEWVAWQLTDAGGHSRTRFVELADWTEFPAGDARWQRNTAVFTPQ